MFARWVWRSLSLLLESVAPRALHFGRPRVPHISAMFDLEKLQVFDRFVHGLLGAVELELRNEAFREERLQILIARFGLCKLPPRLRESSRGLRFCDLAFALEHAFELELRKPHFVRRLGLFFLGGDEQQLVLLSRLDELGLRLSELCPRLLELLGKRLRVELHQHVSDIDMRTLGNDFQNLRLATRDRRGIGHRAKRLKRPAFDNLHLERAFLDGGQEHRPRRARLEKANGQERQRETTPREEGAARMYH